MSIILDHRLREYIPRDDADFPVTYFHDELGTLPGRSGPLHWHPDFEIATTESSTVDFQVGEHHIILEAGDSIFINQNILHAIKQLSGTEAEPMPNIVFSGTLLASETSTVYQKYVQPVVQCDSLPFIVFRDSDRAHREINRLIKDIYEQMSGKQQACRELLVQRNINEIFEWIYRNFDKLPRTQSVRIQMINQIRVRKMLTYIYENYAAPVKLSDIAKAANISRSEAERCFQKYMGCSPVEALIRHRLQVAHGLLNEKTLSVQEISFACGFNSANYFSRQFKKIYGHTPGQNRDLGK